MDNSARTRIARAFTVAASITAVTTTIVAAPTNATAPDQERPCFIVQSRWNTAIDGPAPTCATPQWQQASRRTAPVEEPEVATIADCVDPSRRPVVTTCPYPITSGDQFSQYWQHADREVVDPDVGRREFHDEYGQPGR